MRVGHIEYGGAVRLFYIGQRIERLARPRSRDRGRYRQFLSLASGAFCPKASAPANQIVSGPARADMRFNRSLPLPHLRWDTLPYLAGEIAHHWGKLRKCDCVRAFRPI
jgi:hypothetical protein